MDQFAFTHIAPHISKGRTDMMLIITFFGNHLFLIPANLLFLTYLLNKKEKAWAVLLLINSLGGLLLELLIKEVIHRYRPEDSLIPGGVPGWSFPSGHAMMSSLFYGILIYYGYNRFRENWQKRVWALLLVFFILIISFSRIYLRVHYLSDILAGLSAGFAWLVISVWLLNYLKPALKTES